MPSAATHCAGELGADLWSIMRTFTPAIANAFAHITPAGPAPTISTSTSVSLGAIGDDMVSRMGKPMRAEGLSGRPPAAQGASYTRTASDGWRSEHGPGCHPDVPIGHASRRRYPSEPAFRGLCCRIWWCAPHAKIGGWVWAVANRRGMTCSGNLSPPTKR